MKVRWAQLKRLFPNQDREAEVHRGSLHQLNFKGSLYRLMLVLVSTVPDFSNGKSMNPGKTEVVKLHPKSELDKSKLVRHQRISIILLKDNKKIPRFPSQFYSIQDYRMVTIYRLLVRSKVWRASLNRWPPHCSKCVASRVTKLLDKWALSPFYKTISTNLNSHVSRTKEFNLNLHQTTLSLIPITSR